MLDARQPTLDRPVSPQQPLRRTSAKIVAFIICAEGQEIRTDPENILIRQLLQRREKAVGKGKQDKGKATDKGKRPAEAPHDRGGAKRSHCEAGASGIHTCLVLQRSAVTPCKLFAAE